MGFAGDPLLNLNHCSYLSTLWHEGHSFSATGFQEGCHMLGTAKNERDRIH